MDQTLWEYLFIILGKFAFYSIAIASVSVQREFGVRNLDVGKLGKFLVGLRAVGV
jgi:hypothetical protein